MNKNVRSILLLVLLIIIPFLIYAYLQVKSLSDDEKMADVIYKKQMETVLFSLNQYADDVMGQWIRRLSSEHQSIQKNANDLTVNNESIQMLVVRKMETKSDSICLNDYITPSENLSREVNSWYEKEDSVLNKLTKYLSAGFQKIQPANYWNPIDDLKADQSGITIMIYDDDSVLYNVLLVLEPNYWVEQVLGSKMQAIDQEDFRLAVLQYSTGQESPHIVYDTDPFSLSKSYIKKALWILPNTFLAIQPKGKSYGDIVRARSKTNSYFLFFSILVVLAGAFILMRNIKNALRVAQLKSDFVSNVSHEIRTPLSLIKMYAETLLLGRLPSEEKKQHYYQVIHHESGRLTYLVNNILDFSKIEANKKTYQMVNADMNKLIEELCSNYSYSFKEKGVSCELALSDDSIPIKTDAQAFEEALSNLIENAIKYSEKDMSIKISTAIENGFGICHVTDKGVGIEKKEQTQIFEKFYRIEGALTQKTKGTGLGLSLVKHIMDSHGGQVLVSSKKDHGSTFTLKFPLNQDQL